MKALCFLLFVAVASAQTCPTLFLTPDIRTGVLSSNWQFPADCSYRYQDNMNCNYTLLSGSANSGGGVTVNFQNFGLESCCDYVQLLYTNGSTGGTASERFTGRLGNFERFLPAYRGTPVQLVFRTDASVTDTGFLMQFRTSGAAPGSSYRLGGSLQADGGGAFRGSFQLVPERKRK